MAVFEDVFGLSPGHMLCEVRSAPQMRGHRRWEHEEYDARGVLAAIYESWTMQRFDPLDANGASGIVGFVKYSPHGWPLRRCGSLPTRLTGGYGLGPAAA